MEQKVLVLAVLFSSAGTLTVFPADNFNNARNHCNNLGETLPVVKKYEELSALLYLIENKINVDIWIGLYINSTDSQYQWIDGNYLTTNWATIKPNRLTTNPCVNLNQSLNYQWVNTKCEYLFEYVCTNLDQSMSSFELMLTPTSYDDARSDCQLRGKDLLMIKTRQQQQEVVDFINNRASFVWIGLTFVGGQAKQFREFQWIDGEMLDSSFWRFPDVSVKNRCAAMTPSNSFIWKPLDCTLLRQYICLEPFKVQGIPSQNYFDYVGDNLLSMSSPLQESQLIKSRLRCARECSKVMACNAYSIQGKFCNIYSELNLNASAGATGRKFWKRREYL